MGATEQAFAEATSNPHPPGTMAAAWWDFGRALEHFFAPFWDWMEERTVRQLLTAFAVVFVILVALCVAARSFVPLALGIVFWCAGGLFVGRGSQRS